MIEGKTMLFRAIACAAFVSAGCHSLALSSAPKKAPLLAASEDAVRAKAAFQSALAAGDYQAIPSVTEALTAAYLKAPADPTLALYVAHAHFWRVTERVREPSPRPTLTDDLLVAQAYFVEAQKLAPEDHRILGWLGGVRMALGKIHADERMVRDGYFTLQDGVSAFPEFNHFSKSYALSQLPRTHERFGEALEAMWLSIEACQAKFDRKNPDYARHFDPNAPSQGPARVCYNVPAAPHNFEGFFLHNGDMLVKAGDAARAKVMYANARIVPSFKTWQFRGMLEDRILTADERARAFAAPDSRALPEMMVNSRAGCTGCHQR